MINRKRKIRLFKWEISSGGFTLIEVLVSIAILAIISVALLLLFNHSFLGIIKSGNKAENIYKVQQQLENKVENVENVADTPDEEITLKFDNGPEIIVHGKYIEESVVSDEPLEDANLTYFKPISSEKVVK